MKRVMHYEWENINGDLFWYNKAIHNYLLKGELERRYMRMARWTGKKQLKMKGEKNDK